MRAWPNNRPRPLQSKVMSRARRPCQLLLPALLCATLAAAARADGSPADTVVIKTPSGALRGAAQDGMHSFLGVPYARPPVGDLRWRAPQPLPAWAGTRDALQFGPECMQGAGRAPVPMSEDCLFLNVWVAAPPAARKLPDLVWVPGGAFRVG